MVAAVCAPTLVSVRAPDRRNVATKAVAFCDRSTAIGSDPYDHTSADPYDVSEAANTYDHTSAVTYDVSEAANIDPAASKGPGGSLQDHLHWRWGRSASRQSSRSVDETPHDLTRPALVSPG